MVLCEPYDIKSLGHVIQIRCWVHLHFYPNLGNLFICLVVSTVRLVDTAVISNQNYMRLRRATSSKTKQF